MAARTKGDADEGRRSGDDQWSSAVRRDVVLPALTSREREVLEELATGASYAEIGRELGIAINTVRTHIRAVYDKLGVENRAEAVNLAWNLAFLRAAE